MAAKRNTAKAYRNQSPGWMLGGGLPITKDIGRQALLDLADQLDPQESGLALLEAPEDDVWVPPPDIVHWAHKNFIDKETGKLVILIDHQRRLLRKIFEMIWSKMVVTVVWSEIKKSGKTTIAGLAGAYWGTFVDPPNEIISIANDQEQAQGRIYAAMTSTMEKLGWNVPEAKPQMTNPLTGSKIRAISTNYAGEAGGNYGLTEWSELWAYVSEARKRLWEEMTPVPTRRFSIRWVETYAGYKDESDLLWKLYCQAFKDGDENFPLGEKVKGLEDLPVWYIRDAKMLVYWSHEPRMPWQTPEYYAQQQADLRPNAFMRLHRNMWVSSVDAFIEPAEWDALGKCEPLGDDGDERPIVLGADGSTHGDSTSLVAAVWDSKRKAADIVRTWIWYPAKVEGIEKPTVDLTATLGAEITRLMDNYNVLGVVYDPMQLHSIMLDLHKKYDRLGTKKLFEEFTQTTMRVVSDTFLWQKIKDKTLRHDGDRGLREHMLNAVAHDTGRGIRLAKEKTTAKMDAAVAASMAAYGASTKTKTKRGFLAP